MSGGSGAAVVGRTDRPSDRVRPSSEVLVSLGRKLDALSPRTLRWVVREAGERADLLERLRLLAPPEEMAAVSALLRESDFRPVTLAERCRAPDASDWFGVDGERGALLHVCLQRRLVLGSAADGWLPIERARHAAVSRGGAATDEAIGRPEAMSHALELCERTLRGQRRPEAAGEARPSVPSVETFAALVGASSATGLRDAVLDADATTLRERLSALDERDRIGARLRERARRGLTAVGHGGRRAPPRPRGERRGLAFAVIGSDGSGKSTVSRWLVESLDAAFGARFVYFGTGDGPGSPLRRGLNVLRRRSRFGAVPAHSAAEHEPAVAPRRAVDAAPTVLRLVWAAVVAWERVIKMRALERARRRGYIVVTDRYPQDERGGIHDGPRLGYLLDAGGGGPAGACARLERRVYTWLARHAPDRVLLLDVPLELACRRRPDEPVPELRQRIAVARSLRYGGAPRIVLDASAPLGAVKSRALRTALEALSDGAAEP